jgi:hypothetical protein
MILDVRSLFKYNLGIFAFKNFSNFYPDLLSFHVPVMGRPYNSRVPVRQLRIENFHLEGRRNSTVVQMSYLWNTIWPNLTEGIELKLFKVGYRLNILDDQRQRDANY